MDNENPEISKTKLPQFKLNLENEKLKNITIESIYQLLRNITDPEHPYTLEELSIIDLNDIRVYSIEKSEVLCKSGFPIHVIEVVFTPTVPHCSMAGIIGLSIHFQLQKYIDNHIIDVKVKKDTHSTYQQLNKQLSDKDRRMAAFDNEDMLELIKECINQKTYTVDSL